MKLFKLITFCSVISIAMALAGCNSENKVSESAPTPAPATPISFEIFMQASLEGETETIKEAIKNGQDVNATSPDGNTALMLASYNGHSEIVKLLIDAKANVTAKDAGDRTALMYACTGTDSATVELLLRHDAKVNAVDNGEHFSPLMWAAAEGNSEICTILLAKGADPNMKDVDGDTAASFATQRGHTELANTLKAAEKKSEKK